jgi:hypothetical protein
VLSPSRAHRSPAMTAVTWLQLLAHATTREEVITTARDYIANIDRAVLAGLPAELQPGKLFDTHDIASYAYELARHHDDTDPEAAQTIKGLAAFFSEAVSRLAVLASPRPASNETVKFFSS